MLGILGCIFDLDGVLVDTARYHYLSWARLARELGFEFTEQQNEPLKGASREESLQLLLSVGKIKVSPTVQETLMRRKNQWFQEYVEKMTPSEVLEGVFTLLDELKKLNILLAIGSSSKNARTVLEKTGLKPYFETVIDGHSIQNAKPHPEIFLKAASALNLFPSDCIVFEDAAKGVEAAKRGGFKVIGIGQKENVGEADCVFPALKNCSVKDVFECAGFLDI